MHQVDVILRRQALRPADHVCIQRRSLLHDQRIRGDMLQPKLIERLDRIQMILHRLPRQAIHEIRADVRKAGRSCTFIVLYEIRITMYAPNGFQKNVVRALQAHGKAVDAGIPVFMQLFRIKRARICLDGNLRIRRDLIGSAQRIEQQLYCADRQDGRRAAAEKYRVICLLRQCRSGKPHLLEERSAVFPHAFAVRKGNEIAVAALRLAKWDVNI